MAPRVFDRQRAGAELLERAGCLGRHSDSPSHYTRTFLTPAHREAAGQIASWMREAGMAVRTDAIGNVIGRFGPDDAPILLMGSHFDSVRNGGKFDGVLGILTPIACVAELSRRKARLPFAVEVVAFSDEEGARFQTSFLSSRALIGRFDPAVLDRRDADGVSFVEALRAAGLEPSRIPEAAMDVGRIAAYVELHIEQGPVLLQEGLALGVVTSIAGGSRYRVKVEGEAGHAGTVPMPMRRDAMAAAAEMVLAVEGRCSSGEPLVGTVGVLHVRDGTGNVIPGEVEFTCDIRSSGDAIREAAERDVLSCFADIASRRRVRLTHARTHHVKAVPCSPRLQDALAASITRTLGDGQPARRLPSGAGHDAMILAQVTPVGMIFVRCGAGGVSHNPAETVSAEDAGLAAAALLDFIEHFA